MASEKLLTNGSTKLHIRRATREDIPSLQGLCEQLGYPSTEAEIKSRLNDLLNSPKHTLLVAETASGQIIGWVHGCIRELLIVAPHIEVGGMVVDKTFRNQGIGKELLTGIEDWGMGKGIFTIYVRSNQTRVDAHRFYLNQGYRQIKKSLTFRKGLN